MSDQTPSPPPAAAPVAALWSVRLVDRRTGDTARVNGSPLMRITTTPGAAAAELLAGRDVAQWQVLTAPFGAAPARSPRAPRRIAPHRAALPTLDIR